MMLRAFGETLRFLSLRLPRVSGIGLVVFVAVPFLVPLAALFLFLALFASVAHRPCLIFILIISDELCAARPPLPQPCLALSSSERLPHRRWPQDRKSVV